MNTANRADQAKVGDLIIGTDGRALRIVEIRGDGIVTDSVGQALCACDGSKYSQSWAAAADFSTLACYRCGGQPRPEQDRELAEQWRRAMSGQPTPRLSQVN